MTGQQLWEAALFGDAAKASTAAVYTRRAVLHQLLGRAWSTPLQAAYLTRKSAD
jgi:hypothetical protein